MKFACLYKGPVIDMFVFVVCLSRIPILVKNVKDRVKGEGDRHGVRSPVLISARWVWFLLEVGGTFSS